MPKQIQLPDGTIGEFPDSMDDAAISGVLTKQFPPKSPTTNQPGFLQRFGESVGLPTSAEQLKGMQPTIASTLGGPAFTGGKMLLDYGRNLLNEGKKAAQITKDAGENIQAGQPMLPNIASAGLAGLEAAGRGVLAPVGGASVINGGEDLAQGNLPGYAGNALGTLANLMLLRGATHPAAPSAIDKLSFAAGPGMHESIGKTLADLHATQPNAAPVRTVGDFHDLVKKSKQSLQDEASNALGPIAPNPVVPMGIGQKIRDLITPNMDLTQAGREAKRQIENSAIEFEQPGWTLGKLDAERMQRNADLASVHKKSPLAKYTAEKGNTNVAIDQAVSNGIRDLIYPQMDTAAGKPSGYFADLKRRQGHLINLEDTLGERVKDLQDSQARIAGAPKLSRSQIANGAAGKTGLIDAALNLVKKPNPLGEANSAAAAGLRTPNPLATGAIRSLPVRYLMTMPEDDEHHLVTLPAGHPLAATNPAQ